MFHCQENERAATEFGQLWDSLQAIQKQQEKGEGRPEDCKLLTAVCAMENIIGSDSGAALLKRLEASSILKIKEEIQAKKSLGKAYKTLNSEIESALKLTDDSGTNSDLLKRAGELVSAAKLLIACQSCCLVGNIIEGTDKDPVSRVKSGLAASILVQSSLVKSSQAWPRPRVSL